MGIFRKRFYRKKRTIVLTKTSVIAYTLTCDSGSFSVTGSTASLKSGRKLSASSGSFSISGTNISLEIGKKLSCESASFTISGTATSLKKSSRLICDSGPFTISGTNAGLSKGLKLLCDSGSYSLSGQSASLKQNHLLNAASGSIAIIGSDTNLISSKKIGCGSGSFVITGNDANLEVGEEVFAESGSFSISGSSTNLLVSKKLVANSSSFTVSVFDTNFLLTRKLSAQSGSITLQGGDATLTYSGAVTPPPTPEPEPTRSEPSSLSRGSRRVGGAWLDRFLVDRILQSRVKDRKLEIDFFDLLKPETKKIVFKKTNRYVLKCESATFKSIFADAGLFANRKLLCIPGFSIAIFSKAKLRTKKINRIYHQENFQDPENILDETSPVVTTSSSILLNTEDTDVILSFRHFFQGISDENSK